MQLALAEPNYLSHVTGLSHVPHCKLIMNFGERHCELRVVLRGGSSREERIGEFDGEPGFAYLLRVGCGEAHKLSPNVVDDEQVAVRAVIVPQAKIGADGLAVRRIHLNDAAESQKAREGIVRLHAR